MDGGLAKSSSRSLALRQTAIPPASCCIHGSTFLAMIHICGDFQEVQSKEGGSHQVAMTKGRLLKDHNPFSGNPRNWRS